MSASGGPRLVPRFLVTGGTGFIGQHLVPALADRGSVTLLARDRASVDVPGVAFIEGDVRDRAALAAVADCDVVYHMAAVSHVPTASREPALAWDVNATGTLNVLEAARRAERPPRVVLLSSGHVYGPAQYSPVDEAHPLAPVNAYGASKLAGDALARVYHESYGLPTVVVRAFNVYGPGQSPDFVVPGVVRQLLGGKPPVLGDGRPVRDFTFIGDFVDLLVRAGEAEAAVGETMNAGTGEGHTIAELVRTLMRLANVDGEPTFDESRFRANEIMELIVASAKARRLLHWEPRTSFEEGLRLTWEAARDTKWLS